MVLLSVGAAPSEGTSVISGVSSYTVNMTVLVVVLGQIVSISMVVSCIGSQ